MTNLLETAEPQADTVFTASTGRTQAPASSAREAAGNQPASVDGDFNQHREASRHGVANQYPEASRYHDPNQHPEVQSQNQVTLLEKAIYPLLFALLVAVRVPTILKGRFWAEEGTVFFERAWHFPWQQALLMSYGGYLNITANLAGVLAKYLVPLEKACFVSSGLGLIVQTFPVILLCLSNQPWLQNRKFLVAAILIIATLPLSQEIWLSTIGSQCHLTLCVALILGLETRSGWPGVFHKFILVTGALSGPGSFLLLPLYLVRAWIDKSKARLIQAATLGAATLAQFIFFWRPEDRANSGGAVFGVDPALYVNLVCVKHLMGPFLGMQQTTDITKTWHQEYVQQHILSGNANAVAVIVFLIFAATIYRCRASLPKWFFVSGCLLSVLSTFGALGDRASILDPCSCERYYFAPQILFELALLYLAYAGAGWTQKITRAIIIWLLIIAAHEYFWAPGFYKDGPSWPSEIRRLHWDPKHQLNIWPDGWHVHL